MKNSPYLDRPLRELSDLLIARTTPRDRKALILIALETAAAAVKEEDYLHARLFLADAQDHIKALGAKS